MFDISILNQKLAQRREQGLLRQLEPLSRQSACRVRINGRELINFVSNHYLDLSHHPELISATQDALQRYGSGSTGSRLLGGDLQIFHDVERFLARWKGFAEARLYATGYMANVGLISALADARIPVFCDRLIHASVLDGVRLAGAPLHRFRHNDPNDLERLLKQHQGPGWIVVESVYSMDGDLAPLEDYAELAERYAVGLIVDEAHAEGVLGPEGRGLVHEKGLEKRVDAVIATFGKAYGSGGACVFGSSPIATWLTNSSRSFIYSTAMPPAQAISIQTAIEIASREPWRRERVLRSAHMVRERLRQTGLNLLNSASQIIPVVIGDNERALATAQKLREDGLWIAPIREPSVPRGTARLRINISAGHSDQDLDTLIHSLSSIAT